MQLKISRIFSVHNYHIDKDGFDLHGNLTLHGVTKPVVLHAEPLSGGVKDGRGNEHIGTTASTKINRRDYGVNFNGLLDNGGAMVSDDVKVTIDIDFSRKIEAASSETKEKAEKTEKPADTEKKRTDKTSARGHKPDEVSDPKMAPRFCPIQS